MTRAMKLAVGTLALVLATGISPAQALQSGTPVAEEAQSVMLPGDSGEALLWDGGPRAVLLAHGAAYDAASWTEQAEVMQEVGFTVLSIESISPEAVASGVAWLQDEHDAVGVVVIGASAGGGGALSALAEDPDGVEGLILLGATGETEGLGEYPKLFTASEGEGMADQLEEMANEAPGDANRVEIIPGDAHAQATFDNPEGEQLLGAIITFLEENATWPDASGTPMASPTARGNIRRG